MADSNTPAGFSYPTADSNAPAGFSFPFRASDQPANLVPTAIQDFQSTSQFPCPSIHAATWDYETAGSRQSPRRCWPGRRFHYADKN
jgi:hypothetical protein